MHQPSLLQNTKGFTLIEVLIALSIICIIVPLSFFCFSRLTDELTIRHFVEAVNETIYDTQMEAIARADFAQIVFYDDFYYVSINGRTKRILMNPRIEVLSANKSIKINQLGHFSKIDSFFVKLGRISYKFTFLLGQGRFYYQKVSG
ncbi:competence type IV pilus minor pilin ComGD [Sporolactobacillus terrae]|uniref:competence type IV pilus minor pilin ComGD n=1 Tax=Sporolactobacillus terrae TaxID=269673 RepID=UPI00159BAE76|nr:competence type IV pilus minor pilin ComGD [Sporolactobacillus terrae]